MPTDFSTLGGVFQGAVHPVLLADPPAPGAVVTGAFRLSRRLLD